MAFSFTSLLRSNIYTIWMLLKFFLDAIIQPYSCARCSFVMTDGSREVCVFPNSCQWVYFSIDRTAIGLFSKTAVQPQHRHSSQVEHRTTATNFTHEWHRAYSAASTMLVAPVRCLRRVCGVTYQNLIKRSIEQCAASVWHNCVTCGQWPCCDSDSAGLHRRRRCQHID